MLRVRVYRKRINPSSVGILSEPSLATTQNREGTYTEILRSNCRKRFESCKGEQFQSKVDKGTGSHLAEVQAWTTSLRTPTLRNLLASAASRHEGHLDSLAMNPRTQLAQKVCPHDVIMRGALKRERQSGHRSDWSSCRRGDSALKSTDESTWRSARDFGSMVAPAQDEDGAAEEAVEASKKNPFDRRQPLSSRTDTTLSAAFGENGAAKYGRRE
jgi:hypothetical protein